MSAFSSLITNVSALAVAMGNALQVRGFKAGGTAGQVPTKINGTDFNWSWQNQTGGGVTDHGALTGLADNDHPQYAFVSHTHLSADITDATHLATPNSIVKRGASGEASFASTGIGTTALTASGSLGASVSGSGNGANVTGTTGYGVAITAFSAGTGAFIRSESGDHLNVGVGKFVVSNNGDAVFQGTLTASNVNGTTMNETLDGVNATAALAALGITTYANIAAANAALSVGQVYYDTALGSLNAATL